MSMASAAPFSGLRGPGEQRALPPQTQTRECHVRAGTAAGPRRRERPAATRSPGIRHGGHRPRSVRPDEDAKCRRHRRVRRQVDRVHHRRLQRCRKPDGGRVEGVIVDHVVPDRPHGRIGGREGRLGRRERPLPVRPPRVRPADNPVTRYNVPARARDRSRCRSPGPSDLRPVAA